MVTHAFADESDPKKGGTWVGDYGKELCHWEIDQRGKWLKVHFGGGGEQDRARSIRDLDQLSDKELRLRLPELARQIAESVLGEFEE